MAIGMIEVSCMAPAADTVSTTEKTSKRIIIFFVKFFERWAQNHPSNRTNEFVWNVFAGGLSAVVPLDPMGQDDTNQGHQR